MIDRLKIVARPELIARLERGARTGVTLISGPPGVGKTVLIRSWLEASPRRVAWLAVERAEADPQQFWASVVESVRAAVGPDALTPLAPTPDFDGRAVVERLRTELGALAEELVLVLDDLHELASTEALRQLDSLLAPAPTQLRVVLAFRGEVRLRLHARRLAGALTEIRAADLAFTLAQTRELLAASGTVLPEDDLRALYESGTERTVSDYLLSEVLERQSPEVRRLLLRTSMLNRVNGSLADAVAGASGSEATLRALEAAGAFVVSLDRDRTWFRYHRLFADLLRLELRRTAPEEVARGHAAAARWWAANGDPVEAIGHALAAGEWQQAVSLLTDHYFSLTLDGRQATTRGLLRSFPRDTVSADPELALILAADELAQGSLEAAASHLSLAIRRSATVPAGRERRFEVGLALVRLSLARRRGDYASVVDLIPSSGPTEPPETWLDIAMHDDLRTWATMNLGIVEAWSGRSAEGAGHLQQARELARSTGRPYLEVGCLAHWASTATRSSFGLAQAACREAIALAERRGWDADPVIAPALLTLAACLAQTGRFEEAEQWLDRAERILIVELEPALGVLLYGLRGALSMGRERVPPALAAFDRAAQLEALMVSPPRLADQFRSAALRARLGAGETAAVRATLMGLSEEERARGEFREVFAELALVDGDPQAALEALAPITDGTAAVHHVSVVIRALAREASIRARLGEARQAEAAIEAALDLAEPDRLVMPFIQAGNRELLARQPSHRTAHGALLAEILDVFDGRSPNPTPDEPSALREALTEVELRVLRYLPTNLTGSGIAGELYLSTNTIKTHLRHIYAKLDVHTRTQAVERARSLGLLAPTGRRPERGRRRPLRRRR